MGNANISVDISDDRVFVAGTPLGQIRTNAAGELQTSRGRDALSLFKGSFNASIKVGDPLEPTTQMGAQASEAQLTKILDYIEIGKQEGAQCLTGGERALPGGELDAGYFVQPTVFVGENHMRIFQEEIFGPVLAVARFSSPEEAVRLANDTPYGLGAGVRL